VSYRLLPGRVAVRVAEPKHTGLIHMPDQFYDNERERQHSQGLNARSSHLGRVLAVGEPARTPKGGAEIPHGFAPGDEVVFIYTHNEKGWETPWEDGEPCKMIPQQNVLAIVEHDHERAS
jgi:co-chaperonin GroES (HSP10)